MKRNRFTKRRFYLPLLISSIIIWVGAYSVFYLQNVSFLRSGVSTETQNIKQHLREEFNNHYPESIEASGEKVEIQLVASESAVRLFGETKTNVWAYNNQVPGPEIRVKLGQTIVVNFTNLLPQPTTIHWHGVRVPNMMDGVPGVTQDEIQTGESFTYVFTPKDTGTFWFHPHVRGAEQVERGLYGVLIVEDPHEPHFDLDKTFVVDDWQLLQDGQINPYFVTMHDLMHDGRWGNLITVNGSTSEELELKAGSTNKLRFLNTSNGRVYKLNFDSLSAQVLAVDGRSVGELFDAQNFELAPGNRIDVLVQVPKIVERSTFVISDSFTRNVNPLVTIKVAGETNRVFPMQAISLVPLPDWTAANTIDPDVEIVLDARRSNRTNNGMGMGMGMGMGIEWTINGKAYPYYDPISLSYNEVQKIRITNKSSRLHPMHLHGQFFQVIARDGRMVHEPFWRDTVLVHARETIDIAVLPLDKGKWANHCHILEHAEAGMMSIIEVK